MRFFLLICLFALTSVLLSAQAEVTYRLRVPDAEAYVDDVEAILEIAMTGYMAPNRDDLLAEATAISDEVNWRYLERELINARQLGKLYQFYTRVLGSRGYYGDPPGTEWLYPLVQLWVEENSINLAEVSQVPFDDYIIEVDRLRSMGGTWAYLVKILGQPSYQSERPLMGTFVAIPDESDGYSFPPLPSSIDGGVVASGDLDADGQMEIAYIHTVEYASNTYFVGALTVLRLVENRFEAVTSIGYSHGPQGDFVRHWFVNMDKERDLELVWNQLLIADGWDCEFVETSVYDWNTDGQLEQESSQDVYPATFGCLFLQAEQALWSHDYNSAVALYEQAFEQEAINDDFLPYAQIHMALAYLLNSQPDKADAVFSQIREDDSDLARTMVATYENDSRFLPLCQMLYRYAFDGEDYLPVHGAVDRYTGAFSRFVTISFDLDNTTCDIAYHLDAALSDMTFALDESPLVRLEALGLDITGYIQEDLNLDGINEWLIWLDAPGIDPLFFYATDDHYTLTRPRGSADFSSPSADLRQPTEYNHYDILTLPNNTEQVIVNIDFDRDQRAVMNCAGNCGGGPSPSCTYEDRPSFPRSPGDLTLWRFEDGALVNILLAPLCEFVEPDNLFATSIDRLIINAGDYAYSELEYSDIINVVPATYMWDENAETYILPIPEEPELSPTPTIIPVTPTPFPQPEPVYTINYFYPLHSAFVEGDHELVVHIVNIALANKSDTDSELSEYAFRYYRALALEALNRSDEALAEYVTIYEAAPDSAWGMLAELHLEVIETE